MKAARQREIYHELLAHRSLTIEQMVDHFGVSADTVRRDIAELADKGLVNRVYGGATLPAGVNSALPDLGRWRERHADHRAEKVAIAARALEMVPDGSTVALDSGTTAFEAAKQMGRCKDLLVVTNSVRAAAQLVERADHRVYLMGGALGRSLSTFGAFVDEFLDGFSNVDVFLAGAEGITPDAGVTSAQEELVMVKRAVVAKSTRVIVMADGSKFGRRSALQSCPLEMVGAIVTDASAPMQLVEEFRSRGIEVIIAD